MRTFVWRSALNDFTAHGYAEAPLRHVHLANVTIAHAAYTYMEQYEIPSGGDWAIHRGASVFADGAESVTISGNSFEQIDGNGVFLSRFARNCTISKNDFSMIGDSAILIVGASGQGMIDNSKNRNYPAYNLIEVSMYVHYVIHSTINSTARARARTYTLYVCVSHQPCCMNRPARQCD